MAKKVLLKDSDNIELIPITRGELVLDSSGNQAFHSNEFLASDSQPGLMHYVNITNDSILIQPEKKSTIIQLQNSQENLIPITNANAVIVEVNNEKETLTNVLHNIQIDINNSKTILDNRPTEGNTTHSVSSDGVFQELKETVGNIQILLQNV